MKAWLKWGLIGGIIYPVFTYLFGFLYFIFCYSTPRTNLICIFFKTIYSIFSLPTKISWIIPNLYGLQSGYHPLYYLSGYIRFSITIVSGIIIGFIIGLIINWIIQKVRK